MKTNEIMTEKLSIPQQNEILNNLFGFAFFNSSQDKDKPHYVLYDENSEEFYGTVSNLQFDFSTLAGIFSYATYRAKKQGYEDCQSEMRKLLGV